MFGDLSKKLSYVQIRIINTLVMEEKCIFLEEAPGLGDQAIEAKK
jgi:hypothetical protein